MKTILDVIKLSTDYLKEKGIASARRQAEELVGDVLGIGRLQLYTDFDRPLVESELDRCRKSLARRAKGEPNAYIRGEMEFHGCLIKVNPHVLIPRQETEILVDIIFKELMNHELENKILWDLCCGSGCIGIALKKKFPQLHVVLADISENALEVAKENALLNDASVEFLQGDLFQPLKGRKANYLVCNPPYVSEAEYGSLDISVKNFEPRTALVAGREGLEFYERFASELKDYLYPSAKSWFEIGYRQGVAVASLFQGKPWKQRRIDKDWAGHDRFFFLEIE